MSTVRGRNTGKLVNMTLSLFGLGVLAWNELHMSTAARPLSGFNIAEISRSRHGVETNYTAATGLYRKPKKWYACKNEWRRDGCHGY
jgi:hypothetical protein